MTALAPADDHASALVGMGCRFVPLAMDVKGLLPHRDLALTLRLLGHFKRERPDVILSYTIKNNIFGAFAAGALRMPFLPNVTGLGTAFLSGSALERIAEGLYRAAFRSAAGVFFQNADDLALFVDRGLVRGEQAHLLPGSGIDLARFAEAPLPESGAAPGFLLIGRLLRDKGVQEYANAARTVKARFPQARFALLGQLGVDNRSAILSETVAAWQIEGILSYLGHVTDVRPIIGAADCIVLPSYREGTPRTLLEGAAMARPIITTDVPGCRGVVEDGITGFLCQPRCAHSLSDAMTRFIEIPQARRVQMGRAGRAKVEREFNESVVVRAYQECLARIDRCGEVMPTRAGSAPRDRRRALERARGFDPQKHFS